MAPLQEVFSGKGSPVVHSPYYTVQYNTVGRTIASIYNLDSIFTSGFHDSVNVSPQNIYCISAIDLPTYYVLCITYVCVFVCHQLCPVGAWKNSLQAKDFPVSIIGQSK